MKRIILETHKTSVIVFNINFFVDLTQKLGYSNLASAGRIFDAQIAGQLP
jgi:hypothetical protein